MPTARGGGLGHLLQAVLDAAPFDTPSHLHMHVIAGAAPPSAAVPSYSASMNSYLSLTDAPSRSTWLVGWPGGISPPGSHRIPA